MPLQHSSRLRHSVCFLWDLLFKVPNARTCKVILYNVQVFPVCDIFTGRAVMVFSWGTLSFWRVWDPSQVLWLGFPYTSGLPHQPDPRERGYSARHNHQQCKGPGQLLPAANLCLYGSFFGLLLSFCFLFLFLSYFLFSVIRLCWAGQITLPVKGL